MIRRLAPALILLISGCADYAPGRFPSLLPRPIESRDFTETATPPPAVTPDPALDAKAADAQKSVAATHAAFAAAAGRAESLAAAAAGKAVGSDAWINAQTALAELDTYRADSLSLLTDLDQAAIARAAANEPAYPALQTAHDAAQAEFDAEAARITALSSRLPQA